MRFLANTGNRFGIGAALLAVACTWTWFSAARHVMLPEKRTFFVGVWLAAVALGIAAFVKKASWPGRIAAVPGILIGAFLPFTVSISAQILPENAIQVGQGMPSFSALDERGEVFDSERLRGRPVLIKFFRAHW